MKKISLIICLYMIFLSINIFATPTLTNRFIETNKDSAEIEVNGEVASKIFINDVDTNKVISPTGKTLITLDTSGADGSKTLHPRG